MPTAIRSAAVCTDPDTGSYLELATRAARACLERAGVGVDEIGLLVNAGVFRDNNLCEPAVAALVQKRLGLGLRYEPGRVPALSFDVMHGAAGVPHAIDVAESFLRADDVRYALLVAGDAHPSTRRDTDDALYTASGAAMLLEKACAVGGFGRLQTVEPTGPVEPSVWVDIEEAGTNGRATGHAVVGPDPLAVAAAAVRACVAEEGLTESDFADGRAVLLAPAPSSDFPARLAGTLGIPRTAVVGPDPRVGDPYSAAPIHAYLAAQDSGQLTAARTTLLLAAYDASAACLAHRRDAAPVGVATP
ncbi:3-oxoacyl-[acyl-carrier-protein] synthase-3 [Nocardia tenerifensis]|uniref:3-oxoacyl-[acyl-carrier-protein] synthase-3 n=1 Tax=Nocardia tenerifensis TaxID=228006 RepID=A0A318KCK4_9NOCA|nr:hypothetical protein [Nocardia tenerifensis]PXX69276.1 3-oxoacyl-[acyl-carrier-protein] synthase-3 [Nocardia tenerifensis]